MRNRWFWLVNLVLLLLYLWTLTEESSVQLQVIKDTCTAVFRESTQLTRTSSIPCPGLRGGFVGIYFDNSDRKGQLDWGPLDWLTPRSGWRTVYFTEARENGNRLRIVVDDELTGWRQVLGEWRPTWETAVLRWQTPIYGDYLVEAKLRRPEEPAGIILLEPDGENGWAFITNSNGRRGVWWQWRDGKPSDPIVGIPFQKSTLAQGQSLLRRMLRAQQGALLLLLGSWFLARFLEHGLSQINADFSLSLRSPRSLRFIFQPKIIPLLITLAVLAVTVYIASDVLQRIPHVQDSIAYLFQAQTLAGGKLWAAAPSVADSFQQEFLLIRDGRWFGQYPPGFPAILALGVLIDRPWLVNPILAALTIPLLYWLGKELYGRSAGLLTILLATASPFFLFMSGSQMAHPAELFWVCLFMLCWVKALQPAGKRKWSLLAGATIGMILLTRQATAVAVGAPFLLVMAVSTWRGKPTAFSKIFRTTAWMLPTAVPLASLLFLYQFTLTGHPFRDIRLLERPFDRPGFGINIGESPNAFTLSQVGEYLAVDWYTDPDQPPRGHTPARGIYNLEQNWRSLETDLFGWLPIFAAAFIWLGILLRVPSSGDAALLAVIAGTLLIYLFYWADGIMYGPRYFYAAMPAFLLLSARGIQATATWIGGKPGQLAAAAVTGLLIVANLAFFLPGEMAAHRGFNFVDADPRSAVEEAIPGQAIVFITNNAANWWEYGRFFSSNTPWLDGRIIYARDLGSEANLRLLSYFPDHQPYQLENGSLEPFSLNH